MKLAVIDPDAIKIGELYRAAKRGTVEAVKQLIECGVRLRSKKQSLKHGQWLTWLEDHQKVLGFETDRTARMLMAGSNRKSTSDLTDSQALAISRKLWGNDNHRALGTGENEWHTPQEYVDAARSVLGEIDLDPATHEIAQLRIRADHYFTAENDGLLQQWHGRVWLNPPYAQPLIWNFVEKLVCEFTERRVVAAILLTHSYTDTTWFHHAESKAAAICFTRGRIKFIDTDGEECAPTQGQAFFYYGDNAERFRSIFGRFGFIR